MEKEQLAKWLLQHDENVIRLAVMYATNYLQFGVDVTEKWCTAIQQQDALKYAEKRGYIKGQNNVGIVRCKDCKWWHDFHCENDNISRKIQDCGCYPYFNTEGDWFCADGKRKDGDE